MTIAALIAVVSGALVLFWPRSFSARVVRQHGQRLDELRSGAKETYFEERRSLQAYPPVRSELLWRLLGGFLLLAGLWKLFGPGGA